VRDSRIKDLNTERNTYIEKPNLPNGRFEKGLTNKFLTLREHVK
jgi:hypothetical protein